MAWQRGHNDEDSSIRLCSPRLQVGHGGLGDEGRRFPLACKSKSSDLEGGRRRSKSISAQYSQKLSSTGAMFKLKLDGGMRASSSGRGGLRDETGEDCRVGRTTALNLRAVLSAHVTLFSAWTRVLNTSPRGNTAHVMFQRDHQSIYGLRGLGVGVGAAAGRGNPSAKHMEGLWGSVQWGGTILPAALWSVRLQFPVGRP